MWLHRLGGRKHRDEQPKVCPGLQERSLPWTPVSFWVRSCMLWKKDFLGEKASNKHNFCFLPHLWHDNSDIRNQCLLLRSNLERREVYFAEMFCLPAPVCLNYRGWSIFICTYICSICNNLHDMKSDMECTFNSSKGIIKDKFTSHYLPRANSQIFRSS